MNSEATSNDVAVHTIHVRDLAALDALEVLGSITRPVRGKILLGLEGLDPQEQRYWQGRLNRSVFACACGLSATFGLGATISFIAWRLTVSSGLSSLTWGDIALALFAFMAGVGIGKVLGLAAARLTLRRLKLRIHALVVSRIHSKNL